MERRRRIGPELTALEAAKALSVRLNTLYLLIYEGKLEARKDGNGRWLIGREGLKQWRDAARKHNQRRVHGTAPLPEQNKTNEVAV